MKLNEVFSILTGDGKYTEAYLVLHHGEFPVLSGKTNHNGVFGYIDTYDQELPQCLSYSKDGEHSGTIFIQEGKLSLTSHVNILLLRDRYKGKVNLFWFKYKYEPVFKGMVRGKYGIPSLPSEIVNQIEVEIPSIKTQEKELSLFVEKIRICDSLNNAIKEIDRRVIELRQLVIEAKNGEKVDGESLLEPLPKNSGLTEKFLYDYSDPTYPEQIPVYNGAPSPSGYLPSYALSEINKNLIVYNRNEALLVVRKGVKAGTVFVPHDDIYIVGEDIVAIKFRESYKKRIEADWFVREYYNLFRINVTGDEGSATFSLLKMNKMQFAIPSITIQKEMVEKYKEVDVVIAELSSMREELKKRVTLILNCTLV